VSHMAISRPSAWAIIGVLVAGLLGPAAGVALAAKSQCTGWTDQFHPPTTIRVRRKSGPNVGTVEVVDFWKYVGTVLRAEYSTGGQRGPNWMRVGAITVKQYGWYYAMHWRGGKLEDGTCYDVKDSTADQIYHPEKLVNGEWVPANVPTAANLQAMAETWHITLRKWVPKKLRSRLFLTGYRSGRKHPCGYDSTGFKIFQKSLRDCVTKNLTLEETLRKYFEPKLELVEVRERDILADEGQWLGDVGVLTPNSGATTWRVYPGQADGFGEAVVGSFAIDPTKIVNQGGGDVTGDNLADLVVLLRTGKLRLAVANGTGYADPSTQDLPAGVPTDQMLVGDFDGDLLADVGLLRSTPTPPTADERATLVVMRGSPAGTFGAPIDWWRGALDLSTQQIMGADVNGDGKTDLIMQDPSVGLRYLVAPSFATCADFSTIGPCTAVPGTGLDVAQLWFDRPGWSAAEVKQTTTDFNRDGRSDIVVVAKDGSGAIDVMGLASSKAGAFESPQMMWQANIALNDLTPFGLDVDPDGLGDLALLRRAADGNTTLLWLRAISSGGVSTFAATSAMTDSAFAWSAGNKPY